MQLLGGAAVAYFLRDAVDVCVPLFSYVSEFGANALAFSLTCTVALFWEFGEFLSDQYLGTGVQLSLAETLADLFLGASAYLGLSLLLRPSRKLGRQVSSGAGGSDLTPGCSGRSTPSVLGKE